MLGDKLFHMVTDNVLKIVGCEELEDTYKSNAFFLSFHGEGFIEKLTKLFSYKYTERPKEF